MSWAGGGGEHSLRVKPQGSQGPPRQVNQSLGPAGGGGGEQVSPSPLGHCASRTQPRASKFEFEEKSSSSHLRRLKSFLPPKANRK